MILPKTRDERLITIRRGGSLTDGDHRLLALWAAACAEGALHIFESARPNDERPRLAIEAARAWARGELNMMRCRDYAGAAQDAARGCKGASEGARMAALSAGQAAVVSHVAEHGLGAAAYALRAVMEAAPKAEREAARLAALERQKLCLPREIHALTLEDMRRRNGVCWHMFDIGEGAAIRPITPSDGALLAEFLYHAVFVPPGAAPPPREIINRPELSVYVQGFGGRGDCGVAAEYGGKAVGAAWARLIRAYGYADDDTPELAASVLPEYRGLGVGSAMLAALLGELRERGHARASLSVQKANPAARLYRRLGFKALREHGDDSVMVKEL